MAIELICAFPTREQDSTGYEQGRGLGLISMRERLRLVEGHLSIESQPSRGTQIRVRVPLAISSARAPTQGKN